MKLFFTYLQLELKRMFRGIPAIILGMLVFFVIFLGISVMGMTQMKKTADDFDPMKMALVGADGDFFTNLVVNVVKNMDTVKNAFSFDNTTEEEAKQGVKENKYGAILLFPENYASRFAHGENAKIEIRYGHGNITIFGYVITRMADFMATIMVQSEKNIYAMQDSFRILNIDGEDKAVRKLNSNYFSAVLDRENLYREEIVTPTENLSVFTYYFCDGIVVLFLLAGLQCGGMLQRRDNTIDKKLKLAGLGIYKGILARLISLIATFSIIYFPVAISSVFINNALLNKGIILVDGSTLQVVIALLRAWIILIPACMMILCVYEIVNDRALGVFSLFLIIVTLGIVSGCFYPITFMPDFVRNISMLTVTRNMFCYVMGCMTGTKSTIYMIIMLLHAVLLFVATGLVKNYQLRRAQ
ncbi:MAG: ABC transporter permease [Lachnospiraceae bacterium]|nr:ABC transporter permease [Lachnospiraceae bacterium]